MPKLDRRTALPPTEDVLDAILPPREWTNDGQLWIQHVSSIPATRTDVIWLQEQLDLKLQQRQARETGICPIREELYAQCFDEMIRQITVNCVERGLLLVRVRDEIRQSIAMYQNLYESSIAFGMRKALMSEQRKAELAAKIKILTGEVTELERSVEQLAFRCDDMERIEADRVHAEEERHAQEVARLKGGNEELKQQLEMLLAPPTGKK